MPLNRLLLWAVIAFGLDRLSKLVIVEWMNLKERGVIIFLDPYLNFAMGWNRGINFGLFADDAETAKWILIIVAFGISGWLFWWARRQSARLIHIGAGLVIGGALGNVWDRFQYGAVADYLNMSCCGIRNPYTFNVADIFIFAGAALLIFATNREDKKA
ncbi:signal peptidase II [Pontivivens insulae]|uniref:Lipoprotein signal peptidase n=1 Tax=Pontivivens insulae TaxID=1639689 RepID=A0A2R8A8A2_9RHOB|nr:signal peptidase II [Pontivivens insulae]RED18561.1 signal peptidase II [Pontivivens insulae]SPF28459.1 Lipoprotein signal peptidase [Pontivivens insulae]